MLHSLNRSLTIPLVTALAISASACNNTPPAPETAEPAAVPVPANASRLDRILAAVPGVDRTLTAFAERSHAPGITWGVVLDGELVHTGSAGFRDVESRTPIDRDTVFRIASMTKSFTALSILKLRDEGRLALDDPAEHIASPIA